MRVLGAVGTVLRPQRSTIEVCATGSGIEGEKNNLGDVSEDDDEYCSLAYSLLLLLSVAHFFVVDNSKANTIQMQKTRQDGATDQDVRVAEATLMMCAQKSFRRLVVSTQCSTKEKQRALCLYSDIVFVLGFLLYRTIVA